MYLRHVESYIRAALRDTRVVAISGPRQSGKTTLARRLAPPKLKFFTLDNQPTLAAAKSDPLAFIRGLDRAVIDEVQRAPDLVLAIKGPGHSISTFGCPSAAAAALLWLAIVPLLLTIAPCCNHRGAPSVLTR